MKTTPSRRPLPYALRAALIPLLLLVSGSGRELVAQAFPIAKFGSAEGLPAPDSSSFDEYGGALAVSALTAVVGSPGSSNQDGKVDVFDRVDSAFVHVATLSEPGGPARAGFGTAVAIDGDTLAVGAPNAHFPSTSPGSVWVYTRNGASFELQQVLQPAGGLLGDQFGRSLSLAGDRLAVGAPFDDDQGAQSGTALIFDRTGTIWSQTALLQADDGAQGDQFGRSLWLDGSTLLVGAWLSDAAAVDGGAAYVFMTDDGINWQQQARLLPASVDPEDHVGESVALLGEQALLGAPLDDTGVDNAGVVYQFTRDSGLWSETTALQGTGLAVEGHFGWSLSVASPLLLVGAPGGGASGAGHATLYELDEVGQFSEAEAIAPTAAGGNAFGTTVATSPNLVLLGAPDADGAVAQAGAVLAYSVSLAGLWVDLGKALAGAGGDPLLLGAGTMIGDDPFEIAMSNALPSLQVFMVLGFSELCLPLKQGFLVPSPDFLFLGLSTDAAGELHFGGNWPVGFPGPFSAFFQVWFPDPAAIGGFAASNGLEAKVAP